MKKNLFHNIGLTARIVLTYPLLLFVTLIVLVAVLGLPEHLADQRRALSKPAEQPLSEAQMRSRRFSRTHRLRWMEDGTLHLKKAIWKSQIEADEIVDENGNVVWEGRRNHDEVPYDYLTFSDLPLSRTSGIISPVLIRRLNTIDYLVNVPDMPVQNPQEKGFRLETWRYDTAKEVFHLYDANGRYSGSLGANGFVKSRKTARALGSFRLGIPSVAKGLCYWIVDRQIFALNINTRTVMKLLPGDSTIDLVDHGGNVGLHAATEDGMHHLISYNAKTKAPEVRSLPIRDAEGNRLNGMMAQVWKEKTLYLYRQDRGGDTDLVDGKTYAEELYRVDEDGVAERINRVEWTYIQPPAGQPAIYVRLIQAISPVWLRLLPEPRGISYPLLADVEQANGFGNWVLWMAHEFGGRNMTGWLLFSALLLGIGIRLKGVHGWPTAGWMLFVLLFGFPALLSWLAIAPRAYVRCAHCGKRTLIHEDACRRCRETGPSKQTLLIHNPLEVRS